MRFRSLYVRYDIDVPCYWRWGCVASFLVEQLTVSFREGEPITYTTYDDMEKDFVSGKVREREGKGQKDAKKTTT